jgi:hypothetical protein
MQDYGGKAVGSGALDELVTEEFARAKASTRYLFTCRFTKVMKLDMLLLRRCLQARSEKGIYVSIDRPHSYTQQNLKMLGVPQDGIIYIDAISKLTGQRAEASQVRFLADGFTLPLLDDLFSRAFVADGVQKHFVKMEDLNFILLDNVNAMLQYVSFDKASKMLSGLTDLIRKYTAMKIFIVLDPGSSPELYTFIKTLTDREIPIREEWL